MTDTEEFDGCSRACRKKGEHTLVWGNCEHAVEPEPRVSIGGVVTAPDGYPSIVLQSIPVSELADRIERVLRRIGEAGGDYQDMARVVALELAKEPT